MTAIFDPRQDVWRRRNQTLLDSGLSGVALIPTRQNPALIPDRKIPHPLAVWRAPSWRRVLALANCARRRLPGARVPLEGPAMCAEPLAAVAATYPLNGPDMTQLGRGTYGA